ncbi:MAG: hypothetical protein ACO1PM_08065 [Acidovorax sp.]
MTVYVLIEGGKVAQKECAPRDGFVEAPDWVTNGCLSSDGGLSFEMPAAPGLDAMRAEAVARVDADVDRIYDQVMGRRQAEYERTEIEAREYAEAGYSGTVPPMVQSWATAKAWTAQAAADDILAVSSAWRTAQEVLRAQRLLRKEQARGAADQAALNSVLAAWAGFVVVIRGQLGIGDA